MEGVVLIPDEKEDLSKDDDGSRYYNIIDLALYNESLLSRSLSVNLKIRL